MPRPAHAPAHAMRQTQAPTARPGHTPERREAEALADALPPLLVEAERIAATVAPGIHGRRRVGPGETFWQFRRYQPGDAATQVDWRQSARSDRLYVREHEWEAAQTVWLWRDGSPSMAYRSAPDLPDKRTRATVIALAVAAVLARAGERIAPLAAGLPPASGRMALRRLAGMLTGPAATGEAETGAAEAKDAAAASLPPAAALPRYSRVVLVSDFLADPDIIAAHLRQCAAQSVRGHMVQVLDPAEEDLPFTGRVEFEGVEEPDHITFGRVESVRPAYRRRLESHRSALEAAARRYGWTFTAHRTDRPAQLPVLAVFAALAGMPELSASARPGAGPGGA